MGRRLGKDHAYVRTQMLLLYKDVLQEGRLPNDAVHSLSVSQGISGASLILSHLC